MRASPIVLRPATTGGLAAVSSRPAPSRLQTGSAIALGAILAFAVLALAGAPFWASTTYYGLIFALGTIWAVRSSMLPWRWKGSPLLVPLACCVVWGLCQLAWEKSVYPFATWYSVISWGAYLTVSVVCLQVFSNAVLREKFLRAILYFGLLVSIFSVVHHFTSGRGDVYWVISTASPNSFGPFVDGDHYAAFIELILPLAILESIRNREHAILHSAIAGFLFASVVACFSRTGVLLTLLELLIVPLVAAYQGFRYTRTMKRTLGAVAMSAILFTAIVGWETVWKRYLESDPYKGRREVLASTLQMFRERPAFGFGLGTYQMGYPKFATFDVDRIVDHAHNDWAEWAATGGVPFVLMMLAVLGWAIAPGVRSIWGIGALVVLIHSLIDFPMQIPAVAGLVFVFLAVLAARENTLKSIDAML